MLIKTSDFSIDLEKNSLGHFPPGKDFNCFGADQLKLLSRFWRRSLSPEFFLKKKFFPKKFLEISKKLQNPKIRSKTAEIFSAWKGFPSISKSKSGKLRSFMIKQTFSPTNFEKPNHLVEMISIFSWKRKRKFGSLQISQIRQNDFFLGQIIFPI